MRSGLSLVWVLLLAVLVAAASAVAATSAGSGMGPVSRISRPAFHGYYDGHKVTYLNTDVSDRAQARTLHVNYAPTLRKAMKGTSEMYIFEGKTAPAQLVVFASEPGEPGYSPLWHETFVHWKTGVAPTLVTGDDKVEDLVKEGMLVERESTIVLNCPIVKAGG